MGLVYGIVPTSPKKVLLSVDGVSLSQVWVTGGWWGSDGKAGHPVASWLRSQAAYEVSGVPGYFLDYEEARRFLLVTDDHVPPSYQDAPSLEEGNPDVKMLYRLKIVRRNAAKAGSESTIHTEVMNLDRAEALAELLEKDPTITVTITPDVFGYLRKAHPHLRVSKARKSNTEFGV